MVEIVDEPIELERALGFVRTERAGAIAVFVGVTRAWTHGVETKYLEYEAYRDMACAKMQELVDEVAAKFGILGAAVIHRVGRVDVGEASLVVAFSSEHRAPVYAALEWYVDRLKAEVPIWKKEHYPEGDPQWIHPNGVVGRQQKL